MVPRESSKIALTITVIIFSIFLVNLIMGAFFNARFMSDVVELVVLLASTICFVVAILLIEKQERFK